MVKKKDLIIAVLITFCLTATLFLIKPIGSQNAGQYDPWLDANDDGIIDMMDIATTAQHFMTTGDPINKTALLLELQSRIDSLNASLEARTPKNGSIFIAPAAFTQNDGHWFDAFIQLPYLRSGAFDAQVQLPNGVIVKNMTCIGYGEAASMEVSLYGYNLSEFSPELFWSTLFMAQAANWYIDPAGALIGFDDTINYNQIDNEHCIYMISATIYGRTSGACLAGVRIDYEYPQ